jgi:hypothetical protein
MVSGGEAVAVAKSVKETLPLVRGVINWIRERRYPKPPKNAIGFVIAIEVLDDGIRSQINNDFVRSLENLLENIQVETPIRLLKLSELLSKRIKTTEDVDRTLSKCRSAFIIWGTARLRKYDGKANFVLDLQSAVRHGLLPENVRGTLAKEISFLLPKRRKISGDNDLEGFEVNAYTVRLAAMYIIATAAGLSGDSEYALQLFEILYLELKKTVPSAIPAEFRNPILYLQEATKKNLGYVNQVRSIQFFEQWRKSRSVSDIELAFRHLSRAEDLGNKNYQGALLRAIYFFVQDRNTKRARRVIAQWKLKETDSSWIYSEAFFYAYEGNLKTAKKWYDKAFRKDTNSTVLVEVEEFLSWVLKDEPEKVQLWFCLGLINYFGKEDLVVAQRDFQTFLSEAQLASEYDGARNLASLYLQEITVGLNNHPKK